MPQVAWLWLHLVAEINALLDSLVVLLAALEMLRLHQDLLSFKPDFLSNTSFLFEFYAILKIKFLCSY